MNPPGTAREALLAEAVGDLGRLLDRLDTIAPQVAASARTLGQASERLERQAQSLDQQLATLTERAKVQAVRHIAARTDELARQTLAQQTRAMEAAAQVIFRREAQAAQCNSDARTRPSLMRSAAWSWSAWLIPLASALLASLATWLLLGGWR